MEGNRRRRRPNAIFMAFGTKGDVLPIAAIATALASNQQHYNVVLITHLAHKYLEAHLVAKGASIVPISTPPVLSMEDAHRTSGLEDFSFSRCKEAIKQHHREECLSAFENIFGEDSSIEGDFVAINFFALVEGWHLAELFRVRCVVVAPYVVPYSMPSSFECRFRSTFPVLYRCLQEAHPGKVCWNDVLHWMWPLFMEDWGSWRSNFLKLSSCPLMDPVTGLPLLHDWPASPLVLYGFSKEVVECPDYWPQSTRICGFWFPPMEWELPYKKCGDFSFTSLENLCIKVGSWMVPTALCNFLKGTPNNFSAPIFIGLNSIGRMGFMKNPQAFLELLKAVLEASDYRAILLSADYEPLNDAIMNMLGSDNNGCDRLSEDGVLLFYDRLFCFSGTIPYSWLFSRCSVSIHHGGSGSTAAALRAGIPQITCPFMLDQFYWAERMSWLGVAPEPLCRDQLLPNNEGEITILQASKLVLNAIEVALSTKVKTCASQIARRISFEDGIGEALRILKEEKICIPRAED
ncbi:hypothetical protein AMTRI_Chr05g73640 [Amborella trichopoda]